MSQRKPCACRIGLRTALIYDAEVLREDVTSVQRVGGLGLTFKEDCNDLRNSKVPDILAELRQFGIEPLIHDPRGNPEEAKHEYNLALQPARGVPDPGRAHRRRQPQGEYVQLGQPKLLNMVRDRGCFIDVKSVSSPDKMERGIQYWSL
jgi:UDP-N-acetyl-D-galactosamine dehydrogenase